MEINLQVLTLFSIPVSLAFIIYFITKYFTIKEYSEKKKEKMLEWVHDTLFDKVYEPLKVYASEISCILYPRGYWKKAEKDYRRDVLLFSVSKFMYYSTMEGQNIVGKSDFFTMYNLSNDYLCRLSEKIIREFKQVYAGTKSALVGGSLEESIVIKLQFLATCGKARNYAEFKPSIEGDRRLNPALALELNLLKETYSGKGYLPEDNREIYSMFVTSLGEIFNEKDPAQKWRRAKLYVYCTLFHKLLAYELHRMYDTWYVGYQDNLDLNELFYTIGRVFEFTESADKYEKLCAEYRELCDREWDIENELDMIMATIKGVIRDNPNAQDELERLRSQQSELENELDEIRKRKGEIQEEKEKIEFSTSDEDISALYDISWDKNKLFEDEINAYPIKSYVESRRRKRYSNHFLCLLISLCLAVSIAGLISFSGIQNILQEKIITAPLLATVVLLSYLVVFLLTFIHISINYLFTNIEVNKRITIDKIKKAFYISSCIAVIALLVCIILSVWYEYDIPILSRIMELI